MLRVFKQYYPIRNIFFILGESIGIYFSLFVPVFLTFNKENITISTIIFLKVLVITFVCQTAIYYADLYEIKNKINIVELITKLLQALGVTCLILACIYIVFPNLLIKTKVFMIGSSIVVVMIVTWRIAYLKILTNGLFDKKIIIVGSGELSHLIIKKIQETVDCGYEISCIVLEKNYHYTIRDAKSPIIMKKHYKGLCELAMRLKVKTIVVAIKEKRGELPTAELLKCRIAGIEVLEGNSFFEMLSGKIIVTHIDPSWLIFSDGFRKSKLLRFFKRATDLTISIMIISFFSPLFLIITILIKLDSPGSVFYTQERIGERKKPFSIYKFRSMKLNAEEETGPTMATKNDPRITRLGKYLRKLRLDELPQVINTLKGDMSFVGPRPERKIFVNKYEKEIPYYNERHSVKPGITGWAQICYNYTDSIEDTTEKLNYDLFYIKNMSAMMDLMIVLRTIKIVLFGRGSR